MVVWLETAALLSHGKLQGQIVHDELAAYAQADIIAAPLSCRKRTGRVRWLHVELSIVSPDDPGSLLSISTRVANAKMDLHRAWYGSAMLITGTRGLSGLSLNLLEDDVAHVPYSRHLSRISHGHARLVHMLCL